MCNAGRFRSQSRCAVGKLGRYRSGAWCSAEHAESHITADKHCDRELIDRTSRISDAHIGHCEEIINICESANMTPDYELTEGDTLPAIEATGFLDANEDPASFLEGDRVILRIQRSGGRDDPIELECDITQESPGKAVSPPLDDLVAGRYTARFVVLPVEGGTLSYPNTATPLYIRVNPNYAVTVEESS
jgi:hypothetical protein